MKKREQKKIWMVVLAGLFSFFIIMGEVYTEFGTLKEVFKSGSSFLIYFLLFILLSLIMYALVSKIFHCLDYYQRKEAKNTLLNTHPFLVTFVVSLVMSIIYLIGFYPGVVVWDGFWQLDSCFGIRALTNHHPALLSLFMGQLMNIGRMFGSDNLGIFLYILLQVIINALVYGYVIKIMSKMKSSKWLIRISFIYFTCFPLLVINSVTYIKDTIYYLLVLFYFVYVYYHFKVEYRREDKKKYGILFLILLFIFLYRNTGFYLGLVSLLSFILYYFKKKREIAKGMSGVLVLFLVLNVGYSAFLKVANIAQSPVREMMSIPLQQTARYLNYYQEDITKEEEESLNQVFSVSLEEVASKYNPNKSDPIKWVFTSNPSKKELFGYFKAWFTMFLRHPFVYIDATLNNTYGYFGPGILNSIEEGIGIFEIEDNTRVNTGYFDVHFNEKTGFMRDFIQTLSEKFSTTFIVQLLYYCFFYVWIILLVSFYAIYKKLYEFLVYLIPLYMTIFTCIISPLNAHMRYLLPAAVCVLPMLAFLEKEKMV